MTPKRKAALQWFFENPEVLGFYASQWPAGAPTRAIVSRMHSQKEIQGGIALQKLTLTGLGRRRLHGDDV